MADDNSSAADPEEDSAGSDSSLEELIATRRDKLARLREAGIEPYPPDFTPTHTAAEVHERWDGLDAGEETGEQATVAGRVVAKRDLGRLVFLELLDDATVLQLMVVVDDLDEGSQLILELLDRGDWIGAAGEVLASKRGELSVRPDGLTLLSKSLRPLPDQHYGLEDVEQRYRRREVDLVVNERTRAVFETRSRVVARLREVLRERGFLEVETPMLHPIPGGAAARPFVTHHNTLDTDLYLRIAPELYLKRLVAGGFTQVFELNRSFRNEGMSTRHNPEFTMLEAYQAFADYRQVMQLCERLVAAVAEAVAGTTELVYQGREVSLEPPYRRRTMLELVREATGDDGLDYGSPAAHLRDTCKKHGVDVEQAWGPGRLVSALYEGLVEDQLWEPTFVVDHPLETSPLARRHRSREHVAERFELIAAGWELANAFTELTDPDDQRARFEQQAQARAAGDEEAMVVDEDFLRALELGLPPTGGLGVGVDRVVMLLADVASIREVILFPTLRPEQGPEGHGA